VDVQAKNKFKSPEQQELKPWREQTPMEEAEASIEEAEEAVAAVVTAAAEAILKHLPTTRARK
jgi:hypothetical protein